ncbi:MAG: YfhO family protein [Oscillospiraceae bacterium]|nr:YfhO family protein [Oscillospiraceae bacterium]
MHSLAEPKRVTAKYCLIAFLAGAAVFLLSALPYAAENGFIFYFYGDFESQQVPFLVYLRQILGGMTVPQYDFNAGLGMDFLDAYSFYNLFSPFTLITVLIPQKAVIYAVPFLIALKLGVCCINGYLYASRFCKEPCCALIASVLYTFSGYQMTNFVFHYMDGIAFFPLLLYALEAAVTEKRRGLFGLAVALCALTNYYLFVIEVIFVILYFLVRLTDETFRIGAKDFFCLGAEALLGTAAAGIVIVSAIVCILGSPRFGESYSLSNIMQMLFYETPWRYARILQSVFTVPDTQGYTNVFPDFRGEYPAGSRWSSQAAYLPLFGMSGVIAAFCTRQKSWQKKLVAICAVIALIPILNSIFSLGRTTYYARWLFAPVLIMSVMTALALENSPEKFRLGIVINGAVVIATAVFTLIFPMEKLSLWETGAYYSDTQKWTNLGLTAAGLIITGIMIFAVKKDENYPKKAAVLVIGAAFVLTESTLLYGMGENRSPDLAVKMRQTYPEFEDTSYGKRVTAVNQFDNFNILWGEGSLYFFNSSVSPYVNEYCEALGFEYYNIYCDYASECLCSVKTLVSNANAFAGFSDKHIFKEQQGIYYIYENPDFIPMGFCYDYCISRERFDALDDDVKNGIMLKAMVVNDTSTVSGYLEELPEEEIYALSDEQLSGECAKRRENYAESFTSDTSGFSAAITLETPELVFFSIPYSENFTAYIDGEKTDFYNANIGFTAVPVPSGSHSIRFEYHSKARDIGTAFSAVGIGGLAVYTAAMMFCKKRTKTDN